MIPHKTLESIRELRQHISGVGVLSGKDCLHIKYFAQRVVKEVAIHTSNLSTN